MVSTILACCKYRINYSNWNPLEQQTSSKFYSKMEKPPLSCTSSKTKRWQEALSPRHARVVAHTHTPLGTVPADFGTISTLFLFGTVEWTPSMRWWWCVLFFYFLVVCTLAAPVLLCSRYLYSMKSCFSLSIWMHRGARTWSRDDSSNEREKWPPCSATNVITSLPNCPWP